MEMLGVILGSSVIAAIIAGVISFANNKRNAELQYVTKERESWREKVRAVTQMVGLLQTATTSVQLKRDSQQYFAELESLINPYGKNTSCPNTELRIQQKNGNITKSRNFEMKFFMSDSHIWDAVCSLKREIASSPSDSLLENPKINEEICNLVYYLECLVKYDWERSKREVLKNKYATKGLIAYILGYFVAVALSFATSYFKTMSVAEDNFSVTTFILFAAVMSISVLLVLELARYAVTHAFAVSLRKRQYHECKMRIFCKGPKSVLLYHFARILSFALVAGVLVTIAYTLNIISVNQIIYPNIYAFLYELSVVVSIPTMLTFFIYGYYMQAYASLEDYDAEEAYVQNIIAQAPDHFFQSPEGNATE